MINIKHHPLGTFKQNPLICRARIGKTTPALASIGQQFVTHRQKIGLHLVSIGKRLFGGGKPDIVMRHQRCQLFD